MRQGIRYSEYQLSLKEWIWYFVQGMGIMAVFVYVFYRSMLAFLIGMIFAFCYPLWKKRELIVKRKKRLMIEFKDAILAMSAGMSAGYAIENAITEATEELKVLYHGDSLMVREMREMVHRLGMNQPIEALFLDLGERSGVEVMEEFAQVFASAKKTGGDLTRIVDRTARLIGEKIQTEQEIDVMTAAKRYEQKIMNAMPICLVIYMDVMSPDFFQNLYQTLFGRVVMTGCLGIYLFAIWLSERILRIEI